MDDKPTIARVAEVAQVATSTVSRVLNGGYVSSEVKARVEKVIRDLGYVPSVTARNLKSGRSGIIGLVVETTRGHWFIDLLQGVEEELSERKLSAALCSLQLNGNHDATAVESWISERRVDGIIFCRPTQKEQGLYRAALDAGLPVTVIAPDDGYRSARVVRAGNRDAAFDMGVHIAELGHKKIAFYGGPASSVDTRDRLAGLRDGLKSMEVTLADEQVNFMESYTPESGMLAAEEWSRRRGKNASTAVVLGNDEMALGFMRVIQSKGIRVPEDVSVAGFDGIAPGAYSWPGLTTAAQPARDMGRVACRTLLQQVGGEGATQALVMELPMTLVLRESTGAAPRAGGSPRRNGS